MRAVWRTDRHVARTGEAMASTVRLSAVQMTSTRWDRYQKRRARGICATCPTKVEDYNHCFTCRQRLSLRAQERRAMKKAA
jgi:hypothetical protein